MNSKYAGAILMLTAAGASAQITNNGFDTGVVSAGGSAQLPSPWSSTVPGNTSVSFDTWDDTGSNGLLPITAAVFTGVTAQSGHRWAGGWNFENMSQLMSFTLTPGQQYVVSAWVHAPNLPGGYVSGGWQFGLGATAFSTPGIVATFPATVTWSSGWTFQSASFAAPANSSSLLYFFPQVYKTGSLSTYMGIDDVSIHPAPEPGSVALVGLAGLTCLRRRRP